MKKLAAVLLLLVMLTGCIGNNEELERAMALRAKLLSGSCSFDVEITAQKQSPYTKMAQNELALQFYSAGFFNPQMADQALACLDMMDFPRKQ